MSSKKGQTKTNAMRMLDQAGIRYRVSEHDLKDPFISGSDQARMFGQDPDRVFKTLVLSAKKDEYYVCVIPVDATLDMKKAEAAFGVKKLKMLPMKELLTISGYVHGGCSPVGMKKLFPTALEETAQLYDTIFVSGGKVGLQIEIAPEDLIRAVNANYAELAQEL